MLLPEGTASKLPKGEKKIKNAPDLGRVGMLGKGSGSRRGAGKGSRCQSVTEMRDEASWEDNPWQYLAG